MWAASLPQTARRARRTAGRATGHQHTECPARPGIDTPCRSCHSHRWAALVCARCYVSVVVSGSAATSVIQWPMTVRRRLGRPTVSSLSGISGREILRACSPAVSRRGRAGGYMEASTARSASRRPPQARYPGAAGPRTTAALAAKSAVAPMITKVAGAGSGQRQESVAAKSARALPWAAGPDGRFGRQALRAGQAGLRIAPDHTAGS